jgi:hypothetical protein
VHLLPQPRLKSSSGSALFEISLHIVERRKKMSRSSYILPFVKPVGIGAIKEIAYSVAQGIRNCFGRLHQLKMISRKLPIWWIKRKIAVSEALFGCKLIEKLAVGRSCIGWRRGVRLSSSGEGSDGDKCHKTA